MDVKTLNVYAKIAITQKLLFQVIAAEFVQFQTLDLIEASMIFDKFVQQISYLALLITQTFIKFYLSLPSKAKIRCSQVIQFQMILRQALININISIKMKQSSHIESEMYENIFEASQHQYNQFKPPKRSYIQTQKFVSPFFNDHMEQEYVIQRAFQSNNFTSIRDLPNQIKRGVILNQRRQKVGTANYEESLNRTKPYYQKQLQKLSKIRQKKLQQIGTLGYFDIFPYQQSSYDMQKIVKASQMAQNTQKRQLISSIDFRPSGFDTKMKYQDPFSHIDKIFKQQNKASNYIFPFHLPGDIYDAYNQSQKRKKIVSDSLKLAGDFVPSQQEQTLKKPNRSVLTQIVNQIQIFLKKYLKQVGFFIGVNRKDHVQILYEEKFNGQKKIFMLMSKICQHQVLSKYLLRRNLKKWGIVNKQNGSLQFCLLPNWVKNPQQSLTTEGQQKK